MTMAWAHTRYGVGCRHGEAPTQEQVGTFVQLCHMFWERPENTGKLIGVHCTHGFNRTGAMITAYVLHSPP
jgi:mRNA-capping enzyme